MNTNSQSIGIGNLKRVDLRSDGSLVPESCNSNHDTLLENTLFRVLFPASNIVRLDVTAENADILEQVRYAASYDGHLLLPIASRKSACNSQLYFVDEDTHRSIFSRFGKCGEALISFFEILLVPCHSFREEPDLRVALIPQSMPAMHDWRACIRRSVFKKFNLQDAEALQFVMSFAGTQAAGELNIMEDNYADRFDADILLPKRAVKPMPLPIPLNFRGSVVLGVGRITDCEELSQTDVLLTRLQEHVCTATCGATFSNAMNHLLAVKSRPFVSSFSGSRAQARIQ